jgi:hypothetical protein
MITRKTQKKIGDRKIPAIKKDSYPSARERVRGMKISAIR